MGNFFNPGDARYRRKVQVVSFYACTLVAGHAFMMDYGKQEHLFSSIQRFVIRKVDGLYDVQSEEIEGAIEDGRKRKAELALAAAVPVEKASTAASVQTPATVGTNPVKKS
ncbi:hypothetical protein EON65_46045 [archaeon]|nr:MAG: hypothetical protein EON65_46045 [archaeon]